MTQPYYHDSYCNHPQYYGQPTFYQPSYGHPAYEQSTYGQQYLQSEYGQNIYVGQVPPKNKNYAHPQPHPNKYDDNEDSLMVCCAACAAMACLCCLLDAVF